MPGSDKKIGADILRFLCFPQYFNAKAETAAIATLHISPIHYLHLALISDLRYS
jgi:hypothetical protein